MPCSADLFFLNHEIVIIAFKIIESYYLANYFSLMRWVNWKFIIIKLIFLVFLFFIILSVKTRQYDQDERFFIR